MCRGFAVRRQGGAGLETVDRHVLKNHIAGDARESRHARFARVRAGACAPEEGLLFGRGLKAPESEHRDGGPWRLVLDSRFDPVPPPGGLHIAACVGG